MPSPGEYKTVQARILAYAQEIGWSFVSREEAEWRRGFHADGATPVGKGAQGDKFVKLDRAAIDTIKKSEEGKAVKVINLIKSIERTALENSDDPFLVAMAERARAVQESFEDRQSSTEEALAELLKQIERDEERKQTQIAKGLDGLTYFILCKLTDEGVANAEAASKKVREAFAEFTNWRSSEKELRELRKKVTFAIFAEEDDLDKVTALVDSIFTVLQKAAAS